MPVQAEREINESRYREIIVLSKQAVNPVPKLVFFLQPRTVALSASDTDAGLTASGYRADRAARPDDGLLLKPERCGRLLPVWELRRGWGMQDRTLDFGYIFEKTINVVTTRFVDLVILGLIFVGLPYLLLASFSAQWVETSVNSGVYSFDFSFGRFLASILVGLFPFLLQAAVIHTTVETLRGRPTSWGRAVGVALAALIPLIVTSILLSIGISIGLILFIVPGLILMTVWAVTIPALVAEKAGIFGSFSRSAELTKGERWRIFGLILLVWIIMILAAWVFGLVTFGAAMTSLNQDWSVIGVILGAIFNTAASIVGAVGVSVLYVHLRELKGESGLDAISDTFS